MSEVADLEDLEPEHVASLKLLPVSLARFKRAVASVQSEYHCTLAPCPLPPPPHPHRLTPRRIAFRPAAQAQGASAQAVDTAAAAAGATAIRPSELRLGKEIGTGSYGVVYSGTWRGTTVAVKILRASLSHAQMESAAAEIVRELNTMRRVGNHRRIVSLLGICHLQFPARLAIVTDYMRRGSLLDVLKGKTGQPPSTWARQCDDGTLGWSHCVWAFVWICGCGCGCVAVVVVVWMWMWMWMWMWCAYHHDRPHEAGVHGCTSCGWCVSSAQGKRRPQGPGGSKRARG